MAIDRRRCMGLLSAVAAAPALGQMQRPRTVALLFDSLVSPFWLGAIDRMRRYARARGWSTLEAVSNMDDRRQFEQVQSMVQRGVDGIVIVHTDDKAVIPAIRAANAAGVPMVHFNRAPAPTDAYSVAVVADNRKLMDETVSALVNLSAEIPGPYRAVVLLGNLGDANGVHRRDGFNDAIARYGSRIEVVARIATEWNADKAFAGLMNALQAHPEINFLVTSSDFLTPQIEQALRIADKWYPAGHPRHVLIAGFDGDANGYRELNTGYYDVDGVQDLDYEVELTFDALQQMWAGARPPKTLIDPGFVMTRKTLAKERDRMWGYGVVREKNAVVLPGKAGASPPPLPISDLPMASRAVGSGFAQRLDGGAWALLIAGMAAFGHALFSLRTLTDTFLAMLPLAILAGGQLLVLLVGQIDLSMTAVMALTSVLSASVMAGHSGMSRSFLGVAVGLALGVLVGLCNGACTVVLRVPSFLVTLAMMMAGSGAAVWYASSISNTISIGGLPPAFLHIGYGAVVGIPIPLIVCVASLGTLQYILSSTVAGRWMYAVGHNPIAARICGVPVRAVTVGAFMASGLCAALAAVIYTSRLEAGIPTLGHDMLLDVVGSAVIGGVSLFGGRGSVWMVVAGVTFLALLDKSLQLLGLSLFVVLAVKGGAILLAAILDALRAQRAGQRP